LGGFDKPHSVWQSRMQFEGSFINPLRMDREHKRLAQRFKYINAQTTGFGPRGFIDPKHLIAKCRFPPRQRLKTKYGVKRQDPPPVGQYATEDQSFGASREPANSSDGPAKSAQGLHLTTAAVPAIARDQSAGIYRPK
jgi:hypothetical protein